jgi:tyrosyl-tRNA synthetase
MYGKLMSLPDHAMHTYFEALTEIDDAELQEFEQRMANGSLNPRDVKRRMARDIVSEFHSADAAHLAEEHFIRQFTNRQLPDDIPDLHVTEPTSIVDLMLAAHLAESRNKARQLIKQNAVTLMPEGDPNHSQTISDPESVLSITPGAIIKVGKLRYVRIKQ